MRISDWSSDVCSSDLKMSHADWDDVIRVNLNGYYYVSKAAALLFKEQGHGAFVHFTSTSGLIGNFGQANYSAAKMGIVGLSNSIALDMQRFGVTSNCIAPFAWSRLTASIPAETEAETERVERLRPEARRGGKEGARLCRSRGC